MDHSTDNEYPPNYIKGYVYRVLKINGITGNNVRSTSGADVLTIQWFDSDSVHGKWEAVYCNGNSRKPKTSVMKRCDLRILIIEPVMNGDHSFRKVSLRPYFAIAPWLEA